MEAIALIGITLALKQTRINMQECFERSVCAVCGFLIFSELIVLNGKWNFIRSVDNRYFSSGDLHVKVCYLHNEITWVNLLGVTRRGVRLVLLLSQP